MLCPSCPTTTLVITDRQGVEIDYCPTGRGIWLDRGELDKLLERASSMPTASAAGTARTAQGRHPSDFEDSDYRDGKRHHRSRKKSWLNEIFD